jgi:hypothetical protein
LGEIGPDARTALPALVEASTSSNAYLAKEAAAAMTRIASRSA